MAIIVDEARYPFRGQMYCHCMSTTNNRQELHDFAARIRLKRSWFQNDARYPHYDLSPRYRAKALEAGAEEVTSREMVRRIQAYLRGETIMSKRIMYRCPVTGEPTYTGINTSGGGSIKMRSLTLGCNQCGGTHVTGFDTTDLPTDGSVFIEETSEEQQDGVRVRGDAVVSISGAESNGNAGNGFTIDGLDIE